MCCMQLLLSRASLLLVACVGTLLSFRRPLRFFLASHGDLGSVGLSLLFSARDIKVMYKAERGDEADGPNVRRSSIWESFTGFPQASSSPGRERGAASAGEEVIYADPERVKRVWAERYSTCCDLLEDEDEQRLHLLHQIVHEVFEQFGGKWSRRVTIAFFLFFAMPSRTVQKAELLR